MCFELERDRVTCNVTKGVFQDNPSSIDIDVVRDEPSEIDDNELFILTIKHHMSHTPKISIKAIFVEPSINHRTCKMLIRIARYFAYGMMLNKER